MSADTRYWITILPPDRCPYYARLADTARGVLIQVCRRARWNCAAKRSLPTLVGEFTLEVSEHVARDRVMAMLCEVGEDEVLA